MTLENMRYLLALNNRELLERIENLKLTLDITIGANVDTIQDTMEKLSAIMKKLEESSITEIADQLTEINSSIAQIQKDIIDNYADLDDRVKSTMADIKALTDATTLLTQEIHSHVSDTVIHVTQNDKDLWNSILQNAKDYAKALFDGVTSFEVQRVTVLPTTNIRTNCIYLLPANTSTTNNYYNEYMYINNKWEIIGNTNIDLSLYVLKTDLENYAKKDDLHTHANKVVLDKLSEYNGYLYFNEEPIKGGGGGEGGGSLVEASPNNGYIMVDGKNVRVYNDSSIKSLATHTNREVLDKISVSENGELLYNKKRIGLNVYRQDIYSDFNLNVNNLLFDIQNYIEEGFVLAKTELLIQ